MTAIADAPWPRDPLLREYGENWVRIDERHPIDIEFSDPLERGGNNQHAAVRRLRNFLKQRGFVETEYREEEFRNRIVFAPAELPPTKPERSSGARDGALGRPIRCRTPLGAPPDNGPTIDLKNTGA